MRLVAVTTVIWCVVAVFWWFTIGAEVAQAQYSPRSFNEALSEFMGRPIRVGYQGGQGNLFASGATSNAKVGRIHLQRPHYRALTSQDPNAEGLPLALGMLAHEMGHYSPGAADYRGTPNGTGGLDYDLSVPEGLADTYAYTNMLKIAKFLGYRQPKLVAARAVTRFKQFRKANPYDL